MNLCSRSLMSWQKFNRGNFGFLVLFSLLPPWLPLGFRYFAISIPQLRTHAGAVAGSRLVRRDLHLVAAACWLWSLVVASRGRGRGSMRPRTPRPRPRPMPRPLANAGGLALALTPASNSRRPPDGQTTANNSRHSAERRRHAAKTKPEAGKLHRVCVLQLIHLPIVCWYALVPSSSHGL